ncbi:MAG: ArnT family glycosyltransferase [Alphaproteobacteria bacterium]
MTALAPGWNDGTVENGREEASRLLAIVLAVAAITRIAATLTVGSSPDLHGDEGDYVAAALSLARGRGYPGAVRAPGYPAWLAGVFAVFGESLAAARLAQVPLALAMVAMVFDLVRPRWGARAAAISAAVVALHPTLVSYGHFLWSETLVSTLLVACAWTLDRYSRSGRESWLAACGVATGLLVLSREMFAPLALAAWAWSAAGADPATWLRRGALLLLPAALLVLPWTARNHALLGRWVPVSTTRWMPMAQGNLLPADGSWLRPSNGSDFLVRYRAVPGEVEREEFARGVALDAIRSEQPGWIAKKLARTNYLLFLPWSQLGRHAARDWLPERWRAVGWPLFALEVIFYLVATAAGIVALWWVPSRGLAPLVVVPIVFQLAVYVVANANHRFRVPMLPLLAVLVGPLLSGVRADDHRALRLAGTLLCLLALAWPAVTWATRPDLRPSSRYAD